MNQELAESLLSRSFAGDADASLLLIQHSGEILRGMCQDKPGGALDRWAMEEAQGDIALQLAKILKYGPRPRSILGLIYIMCKRRVAKLIRDHTEEEEMSDGIPSEDLGPDQVLIRQEVYTLLREAIADLDPQGREVIHRRFWQNQDMSEIGKELGIKKTTLRMKLRRILRHLRNMMAFEGVDSSAVWRK